MEKLVLIDGHSILNRAFYGVPDLTNSSGLHTNAIYGFLNILFKILEEEKPDYLTVAFDVHAPTFRHEIYKEYKGTRKPMPEELREQVPVMKEVLSAMGIATVEKTGLEADDILGTLAKKSEKQGMAVSLVSGDRDLLQIATDGIKVRIPKTKGGKTEIEDYYTSDVVARYQVTPTEFIDLKALMGDTADNIPGVPKVGEKTATELIRTYHSVENLYDHIDEITKKAVKESLINNRKLADLSKDLATIRTDSDVELDKDKARIHNFYTEDAYKILKKLEFKNLLSRFEKKVSHDEITEKFHTVTDLAEAENLFEKAGKEEATGLYLLLDEKRSLLAVCLSFPDGETFFCRREGFLTEDYLADKLRKLSETGKIVCANIKEYYDFLQTDNTDHYFDIILAAYLLNPLKNDYTIQDVANEHLGLMLQEKTEMFGKKSLSAAYAEMEEEVISYISFLVYACVKAAPVLKKKLEETGMDRLMKEIEMPLTCVLYDMEKEGIRVNPEKLKVYGDTLAGRIKELEQEIYRKAGCEFNINSPKQL